MFDQTGLKVSQMIFFIKFFGIVFVVLVLFPSYASQTSFIIISNIVKGDVRVLATVRCLRNTNGFPCLGTEIQTRGMLGDLGKA